MERNDISDKFPLQSLLPTFSLKDVDGHLKGSDYLREGKVALVVFTCNHCPYVKGSEEMLASIVRRLGPEGLRTVTINSNDATKYPEDSYSKMKEKAHLMSLPYPYLYDETQEVARIFDAACTPECYLFGSDGKLCFHGTINDSPRDPAGVQKDYLSLAIRQALEGQPPKPSFVHPLGCSIKWK